MQAIEFKIGKNYHYIDSDDNGYYVDSRNLDINYDLEKIEKKLYCLGFKLESSKLEIGPSQYILNIYPIVDIYSRLRLKKA